MPRIQIIKEEIQEKQCLSPWNLRVQFYFICISIMKLTATLEPFFPVPPLDIVLILDKIDENDPKNAKINGT